MKKFIVLYAVFLTAIIVIYYSLFTFQTYFLGDFEYLFSSMFKSYPLFPYAWSSSGLGYFNAPLLWVITAKAFSIMFLGSILHLGWDAVVVFGFFYPFLIISYVSIFLLFKSVFKSIFFLILAFFIFVTNTYFLMLISGGQIMIALAGSLLPIILLLAINDSIIYSILLGLVFSLQIFFDLRIFYVSLISLFLYVLFSFKSNQKISIRAILKRFNKLFVLPGMIVLGLHMFWILSVLINHQNPIQQLGSAYDSTSAVQYFSFAKFEDAMGLLHPNWPENVFGLTHFMRPEFLLLPILAFASLLFVKKTKDIKEQEQNRNILFFALLGLVGIFLSKGAQDPFGGIYLWLFNHVPGFVMFRDPTKWYMLIALSYSMLIPFTVSHMYELIKTKVKLLSFRLLQGKIFNFQNLFVILVVGYLLFVIRPALLGQLGGTFQPHTLPQDYVTFEKYMVGEKNFSRVLWIPSLERYGFYSPTHPAVGAEQLYQVTSVQGLLHMLSQKQTQTFLQQRGIGYIVVPYDAEGELFVKDRKYDNAEYLKTIEFLRKLPWVREIPGFGRIHVFQVSNAKDLFWVTNSASTKITYTPINPTKYLLHVANAQKGDKIVFASTYDSHWQLTTGRSRITPVPFEQSLNMFVVPQDGTFTATLYYTPQTWVDIGLMISLVTVVIVVGYFSYSFYSARQKQ